VLGTPQLILQQRRLLKLPQRHPGVSTKSVNNHRYRIVFQTSQRTVNKVRLTK